MLLRLRINLVQNRVHSLLDKYDVKCDYDNIFGVKGIRWLKSLKLSDNDKILTCEASKNESRFSTPENWHHGLDYVHPFINQETLFTGEG